jgi:hypothetical protein
MPTHDTVIRVEHRPGWQQRMPYPIDHPEVDARMRAIAANWIRHDSGPVEVTVSAQWKGISREVRAQRGVLWV